MTDTFQPLITEITPMEKLQSLCGIARIYFETDKLILAGGAPRDTLSGVDVKDIDIFVQVTEDQLEGAHKVRTNTPEEINFETIDVVPEYAIDGVSLFTKRCEEFARWLRQHPGGENVKCEFDTAPDNYGGLADLCRITGGPVPVEIIALFQDPVDDVHSYDFTISQVFVTPRGYFETPAASSDRASNTIRYTASTVHDDAARLRSVKRLARLKAKYPSWTYVNTAQLETTGEPK